MNEITPSLQLKGCLHLALDQQAIKVECEGQSIRLTFSSFKALRHFIAFNQTLNKNLPSHFIQDRVSHFHLIYYLADRFIGESRSDLAPTWLGRYVGLERSKIYFRPLLNYFLTFGN